MVEDNVAVIAACIPTMRIIFKRSSLDRMIRSVRSKISLGSLRTSSKDRSDANQFYEDMQSLRGAREASKENTSFEYHLDRLYGGRTVQSHVADGEPDDLNMEERRIRVKRELE